MKETFRILGKVRPTIEGEWNIEKEYTVISIVNDGSSKSYISKQDVPKGILLTNKEYWQPIANNVVNGDTISLLSSKDENGNIKAFDLEEAVNSINETNRRPGLFISFYEKPTDITETYRWNLYQFNSSDINNWNDINYWDSIYYNETKFFGWQEDEDNLYRIRKNPKIGDYAFVGSSIKNAVIYRCRNNNNWSRTEEKVVDYISVNVKGLIEISEDGHWVIEGIDTGVSAIGPQGPQGEPGKGFIDAPADDNFYGRKNNEWAIMHNEKKIAKIYDITDLIIYMFKNGVDEEQSFYHFMYKKGTITKEQYDNLYNAIINNNIIFYNNKTENVNLICSYSMQNKTIHLNSSNTITNTEFKLNVIIDANEDLSEINFNLTIINDDIFHYLTCKNKITPYDKITTDTSFYDAISYLTYIQTGDKNESIIIKEILNIINFESRDISSTVSTEFKDALSKLEYNSNNETKINVNLRAFKKQYYNNYSEDIETKLSRIENINIIIINNDKSNNDYILTVNVKAILAYGLPASIIIVCNINKENNITGTISYASIYDTNDSIIISGFNQDLALKTKGSPNIFLNGAGEYKPIINTENVSSVRVLKPNTFYNITNKLAEINITSLEPISVGYAEYMFQFSSGDNPTVLSLPENIKWIDGQQPVIKANKTYQVSILNNLAIMGEF